MKTLPQKEVKNKVNEIWNEYLGPDASCPINVDSQSYEITKKHLQKPDRWCFDITAVQIPNKKFSSQLKKIFAKIYKSKKNIEIFRLNKFNSIKNSIEIIIIMDKL